MSILDLGLPSSGKLDEAMQMIVPSVEKFLESTGLAQSEHVRLVRAGYSPKEIFGLTDEEMDAMFQSGYQALRGGDVANAQAMFIRLCHLDSLDPRYPCALAASYQLSGSMEAAARTYLVALALDASQVEVYVRLGECLIGAGEDDEAREVLEVAVALAGLGGESVRLQAEKLLASLVRV